MPRLLFVSPDTKFFQSHRLPIALAAIAAGYEVALASPHSPADASLPSAMQKRDVSFRRGGMSPASLSATLGGLNEAVSGFRPDLMHLITAQAVLIGGLVARVRGIPTVSAVTGLGHLFIQTDAATRTKRAVLSAGYRVALNRPANHVIFQNPTDRQIFADMGVLQRCSTSIIPGSGADLGRVSPKPLPPGPFRVLMPSRMLRDKGVEDFVDAAGIARQRGEDTIYTLLGDPDPANPTSVTASDLQEWSSVPNMEHWPHTNDIGDALAKAHLVVLPSYREGFPKTLIDAAAAGRGSVATDVPGCRDAIVPGVTGILVPVRDPQAIADAVAALARDRKRVTAMGVAARAHAEATFGIGTVVSRHLEIYSELLGAIATG